MSRSRLLAAAALAITLATAAGAHAATAAPTAPAGPQLYEYRIPGAAAGTAAQRLFQAGFDVLEQRSGTDLFVLGDAGTARELRAAGFTPSAAQPLAGTAPGRAAGQAPAAPDAAPAAPVD